jgi:hypothetical protein
MSLLGGIQRQAMLNYLPPFMGSRIEAESPQVIRLRRRTRTCSEKPELEMSKR